jgi:chromate transporter
VTDRPAPDAPTPWALFVTFFTIALSGFGGTLPFARRTLVERKAWLTPDDFNETLSLCQTLPGPNIVNLSILVGARARGWRGSITASLGLVGAPVIIVIVLGMLYSRFGGLEVVRHVLVGLGASASGLIVATAARMAGPLLHSRPLIAAPFILAVFVSVAILRFPLPYVMIALGPLSIAAAWLWRRRA